MAVWVEFGRGWPRPYQNPLVGVPFAAPRALPRPVNVQTTA